MRSISPGTEKKTAIKVSYSPKGLYNTLSAFSYHPVGNGPIAAWSDNNRIIPITNVALYWSLSVFIW